VASYVNILPSKARTASTSAEVTVWDKYVAAHIVVDITAGDSPLIVALKGRDLASNKKYTLLSSTLQSNSGTTVLKLGPDYTAGANVAKDYLPYQLFVDVTLSGGTTATYSIGASLI